MERPNRGIIIDNNIKIEGEAITGAYRPLREGEEVEKEHIQKIRQGGEDIQHVPARIYGN